MGKSPSFTERFPDYGISKKDIPYRSAPKRILYYARFRREPFTYAEYLEFRPLSAKRKEYFTKGVEKLAAMGYLTLNGDSYAITKSGVEAVMLLGRRDAVRDNRLHRKTSEEE
jgi:hypothetical protein